MIKIGMTHIIMIINMIIKDNIIIVAIKDDILKKMDIIIKNMIKKDNIKINIQDLDQNHHNLTEKKNILKNSKTIKKIFFQNLNLSLDKKMKIKTKDLDQDLNLLKNIQIKIMINTKILINKYKR